MSCQFFRVVNMSAQSKWRKAKCLFKDEWLQHKDSKDWIKKVPDDEQEAYCTVCMTATSVAGLEISALDIDAKAKNIC